MEYLVIDNFVENPLLEREKALQQKYEPITHNGINYRGICLTQDDDSVSKISELVQQKFSSTTVMYRRYLEQEVNETYIHSDSQIAHVTAILYLSEPAQCYGGTAFWRHKGYNFETTPTHDDLIKAGLKDEPETFKKLYDDGFQENLWSCLGLVPMKFNRLLIFNSARYHSRYPMKSFGDSLANSRLIKVFFCKV